LKVLITGCAGFIGFYVASKLLDGGFDVECIDNLSRGSERRVKILQGRGMKFLLRDVRDVDVVRADAVIHLAALTSVEESWRFPELYHDVNGSGTLRLLQASRRGNVRRFIYASSAAVYGNPVKIPIDEDHPTRPLSPYGASKLAGEAYVNAFGRLMDVVILRLFNVYGYGQNPSYAGVVLRFVESALRGGKPLIYGDGLQTRDFVHVEDVANAFLWALNVEPGIYNIGSGHEVSVLQLLSIVEEVTGRKLEPVFSEPRPGDIKRSCADISRAVSRGWKPVIDLRSGIRRLYESMLRELGEPG